MRILTQRKQIIRTSAITGVALLALGAGVYVGGGTAGASAEPAERATNATEPSLGTPMPAWVDETGRVDPSKAPVSIGVAAFDGTPLLDVNGKPVTSPFREYLQNPDPEAQDKEDRRVRKLQIEDAERRGLEVPGVVSVTDIHSGERLPVDPLFAAGASSEVE